MRLLDRILRRTTKQGFAAALDKERATYPIGHVAQDIDARSDSLDRTTDDELRLDQWENIDTPEVLAAASKLGLTPYEILCKTPAQISDLLEHQKHRAAFHWFDTTVGINKCRQLGDACPILEL